MPVSKDLLNPQQVLFVLRNTDKSLRQVSLQLGCKPDNFYHWLAQQTPSVKAEIKQYKYRSGDYGKKRIKLTQNEYLDFLEKNQCSIGKSAILLGVSESFISGWIAKQGSEFKQKIKKFYRLKKKTETPKPPSTTTPVLPSANNNLPIGRVI